MFNEVTFAAFSDELANIKEAASGRDWSKDRKAPGSMRPGARALSGKARSATEEWVAKNKGPLSARSKELMKLLKKGR
jgi:hypothetical protein